MRKTDVLLVEDNDEARELYAYMLLAAGYRVRAVTNGLEALAEIQLERPDVVVTDIAMPVLSGLDLIVAIRANDELEDLPLVAITSFGKVMRERARAVGANESIDKPTTLEAIRDVIEAALRRP